jgi:hypothetical protein
MGARPAARSSRLPTSGYSWPYRYRYRARVPVVITVAGSVLVALLAGLLTYRNNKRLSTRQDQLVRVNTQLEELYGPLFALSQASSTVFKAFQRLHPHGRAYVAGATLTREQRDVWVHWMLTVFMPLNRRVFETIVTKAHLLEGDDMPACMLDFCAHVAGYEAVVKRWEDQDYQAIGSLLEHPGQAFQDHIRDSFMALRAWQRTLLAQQSLWGFGGLRERPVAQVPHQPG